jgi:preprotein translocase subunit SecD
MLNVAPWRLILVIIATIASVVIALPNIAPADMRALLPYQKTINLGLDLRGGSHLMLSVDSATLQRQRLATTAQAMSQALRDAEPRIRVSSPSVQDGAARVRLTDPAEMDRAIRQLNERVVENSGGGLMGSGQPNLTFTPGAEGLIEARFTEAGISQMLRDSVSQSIEVLRQRIDPTGTAEVSITRQGADRLVVQAPGEQDAEALKRRIGQTAAMTFHMVDDTVTAEDIQQNAIPPNAMLLEPFKPGGAPVVVERQVRLTGEDLARARPGYDQDGSPSVDFTLKPRGQRVFQDITTRFIGKRFAIALDGKVITAPVIRGAILGGSGQITGGFTSPEANELAILLNAGALPAPLIFEEQRTVGAELGQDAINAGAIAGVVAAIMILAFMLLAYGLFGLFACLALVVNFTMILAGMTLIGATLTLPGIAGIILTIAIAVDANVLIYERMRDEVRAGRGPALAIDAGFGRAMVTIIDANLTTILAAVILFMFGVGPVRGFAWTLTIGTITSVFTAVLVTQILIALWFRATRPKTLPI